MKRWLQALILLALGVLILVGLFKVVNPDQVANALRHASAGWLALGLIMYAVFIPLRGWLWKGAIAFSLVSVLLMVTAYVLVSNSARTLGWFSKLTNLLPQRAGKFAY